MSIFDFTLASADLALFPVNSNHISKNVCELVHYTIDQLNNAVNAPTPLSPVKLALLGNVLFNTRLIMQVMVETSTPEEIIQHMTYTPATPAEEGSMEAPQELELCFPLLSSLCAFIVGFSNKIDANNIYIYQESLRLLITLMGTQLGSVFADVNSNRISQPQVFLDAMCLDAITQESRYGDSINANELVSVLLNHVIEQRRFDVDPSKPAPTAAPVPEETPIDLESGAAAPTESTSTWSAFLELGQFFAFPFQEFARMIVTGDTATPLPFSSLAELSICPILVLAIYQPVEGINPYRACLASLGSASASSVTESSSSITPSSSSSSVPLLALSSISKAKTPSFTQLYQCITSRISEDSMLVLLYILLQNNAEFHRFIASRADLDEMLLPLLSNLYQAHEQTRIRVYTILIIMTILTFDDHFVPALQPITVNTPQWFKEKYLPKLPMPEFILLVLLRTLQLNLKAIHDPYLNDNALACLGNIAGHLSNLRFYSSKSLVQTANLFIGRYSSMLGKSNASIRGSSSPNINRSGSAEESAQNESVAPSSLPTPADEYNSTEIIMDPDVVDADGSQTGAELMTALQEMESYIHTLLEIIDCLFRSKPANQVQLIYAMVLDDKSYLQVLLTHPRLCVIAQQLMDFSEQFLREVQSAQCETPTQVVNHISSVALTWKPNPEPAPVADIKFAYQETNASPFFTPFIWKLFLKKPLIFWNPMNITLYSTGIDPNFAGDDEEDDPPRESFDDV